VILAVYTQTFNLSIVDSKGCKKTGSPMSFENLLYVVIANKAIEILLIVPTVGTR
jgi:hypothetical protein